MSSSPFSSKIDTIMTIERHILEQERFHPEATGVLTYLLYDLALAGKMIASQMSRAGLAQILGKTGDVNVQGEQVMKLDKLADETIYSLNDHTGRLAVMASEEHKDIIPIPEQYQTGKYVILYDPLDGSSNIDFNVGVGTIFAIYSRVSPSGPGTVEDCVQKGRKMVAAGYIVYGASTMFVYTTGNGVHGFTLDPSIGEFLLSHEDIKMPSIPTYYSVNQGYFNRWSPGVQKYTQYLQGMTSETSSISMRYVGSLVVDFHRTLLAGGIFYYPWDISKPEGKLRLTYEANPLAFIAEQAGGAASTGMQDILDIQPRSLHQRTSLFIGNKEMVREAEEYIRKYG
ncbi:MAG TPA: class 1 fructose-bisphosphatase [Anaerolineaceae bacterium]|nr:class 1 fructose-bisphosphatase [Anaerolineaceae bacterium]